MSYITYGSGPHRAVLLHGWFGDAQSFTPMLQGIDPDRFTFAAMDFRGYGSAKGSTGPFNMATVATDAIAVCDSLGWAQFSVVGHSMGGKAALRTAILAPNRVQRVCAITPVWAGKAPLDQDTVQFFRSAAEQFDARRAIIDTSTGGRLPSYWSKSVATRSMKTCSARAFAEYFESWALDDFDREAAELANETLVVAGGHDLGVPEQFIRETWLRRLSNARLTVLPESGHYPMDECPLILAAAVSTFLDPS
ncbi:alpha/beta hydrolase [Bradyrhizobium sp. 150]|uniref:alpha/beta fold hydrolase n=1 Tax=Bradyrhizobium sp. 150 TaxID=2782625 RepID=UPI001FFAA05B|nr:alpha/beta hydrolase [Bradyrhizobium sp. 150]